MEFLTEPVLFLLVLAGIKAVIGIRFPWELQIKRKQELALSLESIKSEIPESIYSSMSEKIDDI